MKNADRRTLAAMDNWNPHFAAQSPLLEHLGGFSAALAGEHWPGRARLQELFDIVNLRSASGARLILAAPVGADGYEKRIFERGELEFREGNWHDLFNALTWLAFPRSKAALNARHHAALTEGDAGGVHRRGAVRDALTLFDESGVIAVSSNPVLLQMIREFRWKPLFWEQREMVISRMHFLPFGHALCEKALAPYVGMTGHGLLLDVGNGFSALPLAERIAQIDRRVARQLEDVRALSGPRELSPVPVLGIPGWHDGNERGEFYDDSCYFRSGRRRPEVADNPGTSA